MKSKLSLLLALGFIAISFTQCKKKAADEPIEDPAPTTPAGINTVAEIITANGSALNTVTVDAVNASTINVNGTLIEIPANAFVNATTSGTIGGVVSLSVKTILTKSQVIFSGAGANSSSCRLVATKGCVKATASQNTQSLRLSGGGNFFINIPDVVTTPPPMKKYYAPKVTAVDSNVVWGLGTDVADITTRTFSTSTVYHHASLDSLKWLNVGVLDSAGTYNSTAVTVSVTASQFSKTNTMIFLSFNGSLTVGAMFEISPGIFRIANVPVGKAVNIVGIAVKNGQYYAATLPTTISVTGPINLNLAPVSQTVMKNMVAALP